MKKKKKIQLLSLTSALLVTLSVVGLRISNENKKENEPISNEEFIADVTFDSIESKYDFHQVSDTYDVDAAIGELGIVENKMLPYNMYKVIRFIDKEHYEKIAVVECYLNFTVDENGNITGYYYDMYDMFTKNYLFSTYVYDNTLKINVYDLPSDEVLRVLSYGDLLDLREIALSKGMDENYVDSVATDNIEDRSLLVSEAGRMYVMLVNSYNRVKFDENRQMILK